MDTNIDNILGAGGLVTASDAEKSGISRLKLQAMVRNGLLERVAHGVYARGGELHDEMYILQLRSPRLVFSHETALWLNGLSDRCPLDYHVTAPSGAPFGARLRESCICHYVKPELFDMGLTAKETEFGNQVKTYNAERTICDMIRKESRVGVEDLVGGLKAYAAKRDKDVSLLMQMAERFSVADKMARYMGVLI